MRALRALLDGIVDYAGLYPPAGLDMSAAVAAYATYRSGPAQWMLGRFVLPATRLDEFDAASADGLPEAVPAGPWRLVATGGQDAGLDVARIRQFNQRHQADPGRRVLVDSYETRAATPREIESLAPASRPDVQVAYEVPLPAGRVSPDPALPSLVAAVRCAGGIAKIRTGGLAPEAIPPAGLVAEFIWQCTAQGVRWKATAGLHHPVRSLQRLTYEADSPVATVHGFLNVFVAGALAPVVARAAPAGAGVRTLTDILEEDDPAAFTFEDESLGWRGQHVPVSAIVAARTSLALSFGSCSFEEPLADLRRLGFGL